MQMKVYYRFATQFIPGWILFTFLLSTYSLVGNAQNLQLIDSLKHALRTTRLENQFDLLNSIGFEYRYSFPDSTILYCNRAFELGKQVKVAKSLARPLSFVGLAMANQGDYKAALEYQNRAIEIAIEQRDTLQLAHGYNNVGRIFFDEGDLVRAYTNFNTAHDLFDRIHDLSGLAYIHRSLAGLFKAKKDFPKALANSQKALRLRKELGDPRATSSAFMELGLVYEEMGDTPSALRQFESADSLATLVNDKITKTELRIGMAEIQFIEKRIEEAAHNAAAVLNVVSEKSNQKIFLRARLLLAKCRMEQKQFKPASIILSQVYESSERSGNLVFQRDAAELLGVVYSRLQNPVQASGYQDIYQSLNQQIQNADLNKEIERLQFQLQIEKTEKENEVLKARQVKDESLIIRQRSENLLLIIVASFVGVLAILIWRVSNRRRKINKQLAEQNLHILQQREEIALQNEALSRRNRELDDLNHEKDTLMNIVAHDLKSPLNRIFGLVHILRLEGNLNDNQLEYIRLLNESTRGGLDLITDLLDVHAWKALQEKPTPSFFYLAEVMHEKLTAHQVVAEAKQIQIVMEVASDLKVFSDTNSLGRILDNLLSNAIKFSPRHSSIELNGAWKDGNLILSVKDNGPGFSEEDKKQLFQKFKKLSARPTAGESSNGLGLAIVKTLVDRQGGVIELRSTMGKGSEFVIQIPAQVYQDVMA